MTDKEREKAFRRARLSVITGRTALLRDTRAEIVRYLNQALARIKAALLEQPTDYQQWALPQLQREIERILRKSAEDSAGTITTAAGKAWGLGEDLVDKPMEATGTQLVGVVPRISTRQLDAMRTFMTDRIKDVSLSAANKINGELGLVVIGSQSPSDAISKVRSILGDASRARATTIVRTELSRAYAVASYERLKAVAARVPGMKKQWRRSGKFHPRLHHDAADGLVVDVDQPFVLYPPTGRVELMFPHDPKAPASEVINCGCTMLPYRDTWTVAQPNRAPGGRNFDGPSLRQLMRASYNPRQKRVPKGQKGGGRWLGVASVAGLAADAMRHPDRHDNHDLGAVAIGNASAVKALAKLDISGYRRLASDDYLRHIFLSHGTMEREAARGQRGVVAQDLKRLGQILNAPDSVTVRESRRHRGDAVLEYRKLIGTDEFVYTERMAPRRYRLQVISLRIHVVRQK